MSFQPEVGATINIGGISYRFTAHPAWPQFPYGQEGRQGTVFQLEGDRKQRKALKVFRYLYRQPASAATAVRLADFAGIPGLTVCERVVLTPSDHPELLREAPELAYAVLMPWIEGKTWVEVMANRALVT